MNDSRIIELDKTSTKICNDHRPTREIKMELSALAESIGVTNPPSNDVMDTIISGLKLKYPDFSMEEIKHAILLYACGEIDDVKRENSTFNSVFLFRVLNAYRMIRGRHYHEQRRMESEKVVPVKTIEVTPEQEAEYQFNEYKRRVLEQKRYDLFLVQWKWVFRHLEAIGKIKMTDDQKIDFMIETKNNELERLRLLLDRSIFANDRASIQRRIDELNDDEHLRDFCRKQLVIDWFKKNISI